MGRAAGPSLLGELILTYWSEELFYSNILFTKRQRWTTKRAFFQHFYKAVTWEPSSSHRIHQRVSTDADTLVVFNRLTKVFEKLQFCGEFNFCDPADIFWSICSWICPCLNGMDAWSYLDSTLSSSVGSIEPH